jgi:hypothetical protein
MQTFKIMKSSKIIFASALVLGSLTLFSFAYHFITPLDKHNVYGPNEVLQYRLHYGFITAGEARIEVHPQLYKVNDKICYKATILGTSTGTFGLMMKIHDTWGTYIDTASKTPQRDYRDLNEGNYHLKEYVQFDHSKNKAAVERIGQDGKVIEQYNLPDHVQDLVGGAYYLRTVNFNALKIGQTVSVPAFFEDQTYQFTVRYMGKERIKSDFGKINAIRLVFVMFDNEVFDGGNSINVWISDDMNKIPIRMEAQMFVGKVAVDLKHYQGLKNPVKFDK